MESYAGIDILKMLVTPETDQRNGEYRRLRAALEAVLEVRLQPSELLCDSMAQLFNSNPQQFVIELLQLVRTAPLDCKMILYQLLQLKQERKIYRKAFLASYCLPKPLSPKYSHVDIEFNSPKVVEIGTGIRLALDVLAGHKTTMQEIDALSQVFGTKEEDYMITLTFNCPDGAENAKASLKTIMATITSLCMVNATAYKILGCFDHRVELLGSKLILCIKFKPEFRKFPAALWDIYRGLIPLEGEDDSVHFSWASTLTCETFVTDEKLSPQTVLINSIFRYKTDVHMEHYRAILDFIRKLILRKDSDSVLGLNVVFSLLEMVSGKARINYSMLDGKEYFKEPLHILREIQRARENGGLARTMEMVPIIRKVFEFGRDFANDFQLAFYVPHFSVKFSAVLPRLGNFLTALTTKPQSTSTPKS